jgi:hypothetical protein
VRRSLQLAALALLLGPALWAGEGTRLRPGEPAEVFVAPGRATTILLDSDQKVAAISLASPILSYRYDRSLNQLEITPAARTPGTETNLNLRIGRHVYILVVRVVDDVRAQYFRRFVPEGDPAADDEVALGRARPLKPVEVDVAGAARAMERLESDPVFAHAHASLRLQALGRRHPWNGCDIDLSAVAQFLDQDLLVFRVRWKNTTPDALYLDPRQYVLVAGGRAIPVIARYSPRNGPVVPPGALETVYLAVQGYRLSRDNDWELDLPPDSEAVGRMMEAGR